MARTATPLDLDTMLHRFEREYLEPNSISPGRRHQQLVFLRNLAASIEHPMAELSAGDVNAFIGSELKRGIHVNTGRKFAGMLRSFASWGGESGLLQFSDELQLVRNPRGSTARSKPNPYKMTEIRGLQRAVAEKYPVLPVYGRGSHAIKRLTSGRSTALRRHAWRHARRLQLEAQIALALELGLRRVEIFNSTLPALHYDNAQVVVLTAKKGPGVIVTRTVPYTTHARQVMQEWLDFRWLLAPPHDSPWLALPMQGSLGDQVRPMTCWGIERALTNVGPWGWHRLRHTAATEWLRAGVPIEKVQVFMGHTSIEQTQAYTKIEDEDVEHAMIAVEGEFARRLGLAA